MTKSICIYAALTSCLWVLFRWYIRRICSTISSDTCGEQSKIKEIFCFFSTLFRSFNILHSRKPNVITILFNGITPRKRFLCWTLKSCYNVWPHDRYGTISQYWVPFSETVSSFNLYCFYSYHILYTNYFVWIIDELSLKSLDSTFW